jgi:hypothetical protein
VFNHLSMTKPSFHYCVRLDTFALRQTPKGPARVAHQAPTLIGC